MAEYDLSKPWNRVVHGTQVLPLINDDHPVMRVHAGPGTGKTFGLVRRVERLVHTDGRGIPGENILVVAFNRVIAKQLARDIGRAVESVPHSGDPVIQTIHGLCLKALGESDTRLLLPHEREMLVYDVLSKHSALATHYKDYWEAEQALRDHEAGHADHLALWQAARRWLEDHHAKLIGDLPAALANRLHGGDFPELRYEQVIVDEFQDLTENEQQLVARIRAPGGAILALGDARQSIYAFRGNDRLGLAKLDALTGETVMDLPMTECQRCPTTIVTAANRLMTLSDEPPMTPTSTAPEANVHVVWWKTPASEAKGMAAAILANVEANPSDLHLAMVTRRQFGYALRDALHDLDANLAIDLSFSESILELWPVRVAFLFFCLLADPDPCTWRAWLGYANSVSDDGFKAPKRNANAYLRFFDAADGAITVDHLTALAAESRTKQRGHGGANLWDRAARALDLFSSTPWDDLTAVQVIDHALDPDRWVPSASTVGKTAAADIALLRDHARRTLAELEDADDPDKKQRHLRTVAGDLRYRIATREPFETPTDAALQITTLWGAKGLTAHHVYVIGLCDQALPGQRSEEYPGTDAEYLDEQLRLFYVSITRSKRTLVLSRPTKVTPGDAKRLRLRAAKAKADQYHVRLDMSRFLQDVIDQLPQAVAGSSWSGCVLT